MTKLATLLCTITLTACQIEEAPPTAVERNPPDYVTDCTKIYHGAWCRADLICSYAPGGHAVKCDLPLCDDYCSSQEQCDQNGNCSCLVRGEIRPCIGDGQ